MERETNAGTKGALHEEDWIASTREYIAFGKRSDLMNAIERCGETEIREFLAEFAATESPSGGLLGIVDALRNNGSGDKAFLMELVLLRFNLKAVGFLPELIGEEECEERLKCLQTCAALSQKLGFKELEGLSLVAWAVLRSRLGFHKHSMELLRIALPLIEAEAVRDSEYLLKLSEAYNVLGNCLAELGDSSSAVKAYESALDALDSYGPAPKEAVWRAQIQSNLGNAYSFLGEHARAKDAFEKALPALAENEEGAAILHNQLGGALMKMGLWDRGFGHFFLALAIGEKVLAKHGFGSEELIRILINISLAFAKMRKYYESQLYGIRAERFYRELADKASTLAPRAKVSLLKAQAMMMHKAGLFREAVRLFRDTVQEMWNIPRGVYITTYDKLQLFGNYAEALSQSGEQEEAEKMSSLCLQETHGLKPPDSLHHLNYLVQALLRHADIHLRGSSFEDAAAALRAAESAIAKIRAFHNRNPENLDPWMLQGRLLHALGKEEEALVFFKNAIARTENTDADSEWETWLNRGKLEVAYQQLAFHSQCHGDPEGVFSACAALRCKIANALAKDGNSEVSAAAAILGQVNRFLDRKVAVLVVQSVELGNTTLFGVLYIGSQWCWSSEASPGWAGAAIELEKRVMESFGSGASRESVSAAIESAGEAAWKALPPIAKEFFAGQFGDTLLISGDAKWTRFFWEALKPGPGKEDYLGLQMPLTRWNDISHYGLRRLARLYAPESKDAVVFSPWDALANSPLPGAKEEGLFVSDKLANHGFSNSLEKMVFEGHDASLANMKRAILGNPRILHFCGHGSIAMNEEFLLVWNEESSAPAGFGRATLDAMRIEAGGKQALFQRGGLIVLTSCMSGNARAYGGLREDLVSVFLEEGAHSVIANPLPFFDEAAKEFSKLFYANLLDSPGPVAGVLLKTRREFFSWLSNTRGGLWASWIPLALHGHPLCGF